MKNILKILSVFFITINIFSLKFAFSENETEKLELIKKYIIDYKKNLNNIIKKYEIKNNKDLEENIKSLDWSIQVIDKVKNNTDIINNRNFLFFIYYTPYNNKIYRDIILCFYYF